MKSILVTLFAVVFAVTSTMAQKAPASPKVVAESKNTVITYGQPSKKDREIFGKLVPYGQVWRTGANEATTVQFKSDVTFGGKKVKAGTYSLFTIPSENEWTIILNSELGQWGAYKYNDIKKNNVAEVKVKATNTASVMEKLTITTDDKKITIGWDKTSVSVDTKF
ncbi:MAG: DUF2911 domain-containing protein [Spirosomataceae bacterium]